MWTNGKFWKDATWRAFRTFCQSLAGLLTVETVSANLNAPWLSLIYASAVAALISLLQSVDRERAFEGSPAVVNATPVISAPITKSTAEDFSELSDPASANYQPPSK